MMKMLEKKESPVQKEEVYFWTSVTFTFLLLNKQTAETTGGEKTGGGGGTPGGQQFPVLSGF